MTVTLDIPDEVARDLQSMGGDLPRTLLEAAALEGYRSRVLSDSQVRRLLGYETCMEAHAFLQEHGVPLNYGEDELEQDLAAVREDFA